MFPFLRFLSPKTKNNNWYLEPFSYWTCRMVGESSFSQVALPVFDGEGYDRWTVRMESCRGTGFMESCARRLYPLPKNPTIAQIKNHKERETKAKARSCLFANVSHQNHDLRHPKKLRLFEGRI